MSLLTYEDARPWARAIRQKVVQREMPPWHIDKSVGIQKFKNDFSLSDDQIATLVKWVDEGGAEGDPADLPPPRKLADPNAWRGVIDGLGQPDLVITSPDLHDAGSPPGRVVATRTAPADYRAALGTRGGDPTGDGRGAQDHAPHHCVSRAERRRS